MHPIQGKLLDLIVPNGIVAVTLRDLGQAIRVKHPQKVKYHLDQLENAGKIIIKRSNGRIISIAPLDVKEFYFHSIPIYGSADCGPATLVAEENFEDYLRVSPSTIDRRNADGLFAIRAVGSSMDRAKIPGGPVEEGDFVIVDSTCQQPNDGDYVLSVIDGYANIKKLTKEERRTVLLSESEKSDAFPPVFIYGGDDFVINGRVIRVVKKPQGGDESGKKSN